jgi:hypothetical protein
MSHFRHYAVLLEDLKGRDLRHIQEVVDLDTLPLYLEARIVADAKIS